MGKPQRLRKTDLGEKKRVGKKKKKIEGGEKISITSSRIILREREKSVVPREKTIKEGRGQKAISS